MKIQDAFRLFLKERFAPKMRELGFKGSGQKYSYPSEDHYIQVGIQKSMYSDSDELTFTLNVQIIEKKEWEDACRVKDYLPKKPSPNTHYGVGTQERIGLMTPDNLDKWWSYGLDTSELTLLGEVFDLIEAYALPEIQKALTSQPNQTVQTTSASRRV